MLIPDWFTQFYADWLTQLNADLCLVDKLYIFNFPASLNRVLDTAISNSVTASADPFSRNLTFLLDQVSERKIGIPGLSLTYQASWPDNIVLSLDTVSKYSLILDFTLELKLTMLSLELDWGNENLVVRREKKSTKDLLHRVNIMRHEMMHFIRNIHDYVASQVNTFF